MTDIAQLADEHLALAREATHGRSAVLLGQDGPLRQTIIALRAGAELGEHNAPVAASVYVLEGAITVVSDSGRNSISEGELAMLVHERHSVEANEDSVFLLTAVTARD
ncbi:cupin domain-containing protein [Arthrobacter monumenti]